MPCGGCGKSRQRVVKSGDVSKRSNKKVVNPKPRTIRVGGKKNVAVQTSTRDKCPTCGGFLRKVSRLGKGDMLQCANPHCGYLRKLRR